MFTFNLAFILSPRHPNLPISSPPIAVSSPSPSISPSPALLPSPPLHPPLPSLSPRSSLLLPRLLARLNLEKKKRRRNNLVVGNNLSILFLPGDSYSLPLSLWYVANVIYIYKPHGLLIQYKMNMRTTSRRVGRKSIKVGPGNATMSYKELWADAKHSVTNYVASFVS